MKTICFFNSTQSWGGGEKWHYEMAAHFSEKGYSVIVVTNRESKLYDKISTKNSVTTVPLKITNLSFLNPFKLFLLARLFLKFKIEVLIMNLPSDLKAAGIAAKIAKVKSIIYRRGSAIPIKNSFLNRFLFKHIVNDIIANSHETKRTIKQNNVNLIPSEKIHVIYNGLNLSKYTPVEGNIDRAHRGRVFLGNAGRLSREKGQGLLLQIAQILKREGLDFQLLIAGDGDDKEKLIKDCKKYNLSTEVIFMGFVKDIVGFFNQIDIFLLTSHWEGFGYVTAEAMACKKPVIAFDVSCNPELIIDNETGSLVPYPDINIFAQKIIELANQKIKQKEMGEKGRKRIERYFSFQQTVKKVETLFENP